MDAFPQHTRVAVPDALARDLAALLAAGFTVERVTPFDMFPGTPHVEVLAVLG